MSETPNLALPYLAAGQAQKHVTLNEALRMLDALVQMGVDTQALAAPPLTPIEGARYLIAASASGLWVGKSGQIAAFQDGGWAFLVPQAGWICWVKDESLLLAFDGSGWISAIGAFQNVAMIGINATADVTNRLAVSAPATLLTHEGAGHQLKINKASTAQTASLLFQSAYSGRAEIGLAGSNDLSIKLSSDGATWQTGLALTATGNAALGTATPLSALHIERASAVLTLLRTDLAGSGGVTMYVRDTPSAANQRLGQFYAGSRLGNDQAQLGAGIIVMTETAWTAGVSCPAFLRFETTEQGEITRTEKMRITGAGKVGIGTSGPTAKLHVNGDLRIGTFTLTTLPDPATSGAGAMIYVSNANGGAVPAFSDGSAWRRMTDRTVVN